jgi:hypothetical protein
LCHERLRWPEGGSLSERILLHPEPARERFVDDRDARPSGGVLFNEIPSTPDRCTHRAEVAWRDLPVFDTRDIRERSRYRLPLDVKKLSPEAPAERILVAAAATVTPGSAPIS